MKKILIIEDEKMLSEMYKDKFKKEGFNVVTAMTCEDGIELAKE
jgi:DNA-binding response OmpR family regulator